MIATQRRNGRKALMVAVLALGGLGTQVPVQAQDTAVSFTSAQADRGRAAYQRGCVDCHGASLDDGEFGGAPLKGNSFKEKWFGMTADSLFGFMSAAMPPERPGSLTPQTYADITAYILAQNGVQPGTTELPADLDRLSTMMLP